MTELYSDEYFMQKALDEAMAAYDAGEIPIGAIVVHGNKIIGRGHNQTEKLTDVTAHAEMIAITAAASFLNSKFLEECTLFVTIEPCVMCAGAIRWARFQRVVYGAAEPKFGYSSTAPGLSLNAEISTGVLESDCKTLMQNFFKARRKN